MKLINCLPSLRKMLDIEGLYYLVSAAWALQSCWLVVSVLFFHCCFIFSLFPYVIILLSVLKNNLTKSKIVPHKINSAAKSVCFTN